MSVNQKRGFLSWLGFGRKNKEAQFIAQQQADAARADAKAKIKQLLEETRLKAQEEAEADRLRFEKTQINAPSNNNQTEDEVMQQRWESAVASLQENASSSVSIESLSDQVTTLKSDPRLETLATEAKKKSAQSLEPKDEKIDKSAALEITSATLATEPTHTQEKSTETQIASDTIKPDVPSPQTPIPDLYNQLSVLEKSLFPELLDSDEVITPVNIEKSDGVEIKQKVSEAETKTAINIVDDELEPAPLNRVSALEQSIFEDLTLIKSADVQENIEKNASDLPPTAKRNLVD